MLPVNLFFGCTIAWLVWNLWFEWLGLSSVVHHTSVSHFLQFNIHEAPTSIHLILGSVWIAVVSEILRHRNKQIFKGGVIDHSKIFSMAQLKAWSLVTSKVPYACFSFLTGVWIP